MSLSGAGKIAGVVGWPISHSLSPAMHAYWLREMNIDGVLVPLAVRPEDFSTVLTGLRRAGFTGVNVTVPHKQAAFALADSNDISAQAAGAANLLLFRDDGRIEGHNTDVAGLRECLREALGGETLRGRDTVLLGAGGAARAAVLALAELGVSRINLLNRHEDRAGTLAAQLAPLVKSQLVPGGMADWSSVAGGAALLVNATSAGMAGRDPLIIDLAPLPGEAAVCDIVYNPLQTNLLARAAARGHICIDGLGMLMHQAVTSFEGFFGTRPRVTLGLRSHLEQAMAGG